MKGSRVFKGNTSQLIQVPEVLPESVKQVDPAPIGRSCMNLPAGDSWESWFSSEGVIADFTPCRDQPEDQMIDGHARIPLVRVVNWAE